MTDRRPSRADEREQRHLTDGARAELLAALLAERYQLTPDDIRGTRRSKERS